ncbi:DUF1566 domain-containing protein [bacterium]|nr:DUF1566 domain-containing protein [bacterium]
MKDEKAKYEAAKENYIKTRRGYFTTVFKKIRKPPKKGDDPAIKRKALFGALAGLEKFDGMNLGDSIDENKVDIKTTATYGRIAIYPYPDKGVMVLVTGSKVVGFVYLIQANVIGDYFPFVKKLAFQNSFSSTPAIETLLHIPPDSLLKSQDEGKVDQTPMLLAELCDVRVNPSEHNPSGNTYIFCCRTDGNTTDILSATVINIDKSGVDIYVTPFSYAMFGHDPILGKDVYEMDLKITMESREQRAARVEEERFAKLQEKHPRLRTNLEEGLRNYQNGNYPWAYSELYEVLKADPENIAAQKVMNSIETHYETNRGTLSANDKDNFLNRLIQIASREEDEKRSITVYEKVLHFDPENRTAKNRIQDYETEQALRTRFIDNGDGTITDTQTQLMWTKKDSFLELNKGLNWEDSKKYVIELQTGGYSDWRMPTRDEAKSLFNHSFSNKSDTSEAYISPLFTKSFAYYCWTSETDDLDAYAFNTRLGDCWGSRRGDVGSCGVRAVRGLIESETSE